MNGLIETAFAAAVLFGCVAQLFYIIILIIFYTIEKQECVDTENYVLMTFRDFKDVYKACPWRFSVHQFSVKDREKGRHIVFSFLDAVRIYCIFNQERRRKRAQQRRNLRNKQRNLRNL